MKQLKQQHEIGTVALKIASVLAASSQCSCTLRLLNLRLTLQLTSSAFMFYVCHPNAAWQASSWRQSLQVGAVVTSPGCLRCHTTGWLTDLSGPPIWLTRLAENMFK
jgi:hypothetical protein